MKLTSVHYFLILIIAVLVLLVGTKYYNTVKPGAYDEFAQCLTDNGATFYGAFWCPHCAEQKDMFGNSMEFVKYVECSLPSGQGQTDECNEVGIETYPTWEFADGSRLTGVQSFETLAEKTSCELTKE